jgi:hypothetical protein
MSFYSTDSVDRSDECGNLFLPSDHFYDAVSSLDKLYAYTMGDNEVSDLNTHLFDASRYDKSPVIGHKLRQYTTPDSGSYGWIQTMASFLRAGENTPMAVRYIRFIHSGSRREISSTKRKVHYTSQDTTSSHNSMNEMDRHADTCCLGKNFIPLYYMGCTMRTSKKRRKKQSRVIPVGDSHVNQ